MSEQLDRLLNRLNLPGWRDLGRGKDPLKRLSRLLDALAKCDVPKLTPLHFVTRGVPLTEHEKKELGRFLSDFRHDCLCIRPVEPDPRRAA